MSTTTVRRIKERGGSGGKISASIPSTKTLTPISEKPSLVTSGRKSIGKENPNSNPRSISRVSGTSQKPVIRSMPRVSDAESRSRSRGRCSSPSDFNRILSDMRKTRVSSEVSNSKGVNGIRVLERKGFRDLNQKSAEKGSNGGRVSIDGKVSGRKEDNLKLSSVDSVKLFVNGVNRLRDKCVDKSDKDVSFNASESESVKQSVVLKIGGDSDVEKNGREAGSKGLSVKSASNLSVCKEKGVSEEGTSGRVANKHTSKLHEKLAYLEGKVKRIAGDIKKTKEMLDMNNTDASKVILSDIQEKISGIEKAMGNVMVDTNVHVTGDCSSNLGNLKSIEIDSGHRTHEENQNVQAESSNLSVKGLNCEELEARLFPHHKLLRNRTSVKESASGSQSDKAQVLELNGRSNSAEVSKVHVDEDPIALEFLASLTKMHTEVGVKDVEVFLDAVKVPDTDDAETSTARRSSGVFSGKHTADVNLQADERLDEFDEQENKPAMMVDEEIDDDSISQLIEIGRKTSTGGWFVSEGESVLLAHDDSSCSFYDIANQEEKAEYRPPAGISENIWRDCWVIRAPSADGCSGKYVVAASAGNTLESGFCSWDFYSKDVRAFHIEDNTTNPRVALGQLADNIMYRRNALSSMMSSENQQWWYRPCGPLLISTASCQKAVKVFDIRDGELIMRWDVPKPVVAMDYCSPLQWRNRGKAVVAEAEAISLWDVSSLSPRALLTVSTSGRKISALHVNNTDAELGGGVRQRVSSSEAEGNDGVFCTADSINILDFRHPSGIGLKMPKIGVSVQSLSSRGDSVFLGCSNVISAVKKQVQSQVLQFSLRKQKIVNTYTLPESNAHSHHKALTQVWGDSNMVMAVCGLGLFVFDTVKNDGLPAFVSDSSSSQNVKEIIGPDDMYSPSFDSLSSQILLISRDRPAMWRHLS
ncbi:KIN14B-interacting protein At4g14310 [Beta vulgaris subsp. vulgaris]|uniref:KIN14B-interacting protein At4g14310 n=1 Tax=Beta vulgaris subsp. vulgaris TaxID=3555 RepID=UPI002036C2BD|nr:KIN14B-interacting protein At4g14310 [Beta vulgaris subsp. vulgaris]